MHDLKINDIATALKIKNSPMGLTGQSGEQMKLSAIANYCLLPLGLVCRHRQLPRARLKKRPHQFSFGPKPESYA